MINVNALIATAIGLYFFIIPAILSIYYINDSNLESAEIPKLAKDIHQQITPKIELWAKKRIENKFGKSVKGNEISGNEWPLFSAIYYLWSTEALQNDFEKNPSSYTTAPKVYAKKAIHAAARLITDPHHATWVKRKWGKNYLYQENIFYRALLISGMNSHINLTGSSKYKEALTKQCQMLATELAESDYGLLNDYPVECYPSDVALAYWAIVSANQTLGLPPDSLLTNSVRGFEQFPDATTGLPTFSLQLDQLKFNQIVGESRGSSSAWLMHFAPMLWENHAKQWMDSLEKHFWQSSWTANGFREFYHQSNNGRSDWGFDIDAGPILAGHGFSASTFGLGATRLMSRFDLAYPLSTELITISFPHIGGKLLLPQLLSDLTHAPLIGELSILYNLTRTPVLQSPQKQAKNKLPLFVVLLNGFTWTLGLLVIWRGIRRTKRGKDLDTSPAYIFVQFILWSLMISWACWHFYLMQHIIGFAIIIVSRLFPILTIENKK